MHDLRLGIIGLGNMGQVHADSVVTGRVSRCQLAAVCDPDQQVLRRYSLARPFSLSSELIASGDVDAVLVATPHYSHATIGIEALEAGLHLLVEKPLCVHKEDCVRLIAAHRSKEQIFAAMFNQRTDPYYLKLLELIRNGELGTIRRINWIITNWFRTAAYYSSGGWRATWAGEGGGVLLNQCPHQLDLWQWLFGMPSKVRAFCQIGRYHDIEVEDDVTAYFEYGNGTTGVFIASTGEAPGTDRLEVTAERGRVVIENDRFLYTRNEVPMSKFCKESPERFSQPSIWNVEIPFRGRGGQHAEVLQNFVDAVLEGKSLIAPAEEGIHSVELANSMLLSSFTDKTVKLPIDADVFGRLLKEKIAGSPRGRKVISVPVRQMDDFSKSFNR
ncbi:MAG TPA: Gfo/Idh/MocA family oxidoreductase [Terrimicrobiaceae bacterium]